MCRRYMTAGYVPTARCNVSPIPFLPTLRCYVPTGPFVTPILTLFNHICSKSPQNQNLAIFTPMTPERRFNQIEPILADVVQKVDRLIEGNGNIIDEVSKIPGIEKETSKISGIEKETSKISGIEQETARIPGIERTVSITAKGLIDLTTSVNKRFDQLQQDVTDVKSGQQLILQILREKLP